MKRVYFFGKSNEIGCKLEKNSKIKYVKEKVNIK